jgi:hypothetical protein
MKHRQAWLLPTAMSIVLGALLIGLSMGPSGAFFTDQVTVERVNVRAGEWVTPSPTPLPVPVAATVVFDQTQFQAADEWTTMTASITLPAGYSVGDIDTESILLCEGQPLCSSGIEPSSTEAGTDALTATFARADVLSIITPPNELPADINLAVSGSVGSAVFVGSGQVKIFDGALDSSDLEPLIATVEPTPLETPTPSPTPTASEEPAVEPSPTPTPTVGDEPPANPPPSPTASDEPPVEPPPEGSAAPPTEGDTPQP